MFLMKKCWYDESNLNYLECIQQILEEGLYNGHSMILMHDIQPGDTIGFFQYRGKQINFDPEDI